MNTLAPALAFEASDRAKHEPTVVRRKHLALRHGHGLDDHLHTRIAAAALAHKIPTMGYHPGMARDGLLMSYGQDFAEYLRKAAVYADKIGRKTS
jgi:hypothetical protein